MSVVVRVMAVLAVVAALTVALVRAGTTSDTRRDDVPAFAAEVAMQPPTPGPTPAARLVPVPAAGTVSQVAGPFDDRVVLDGLALTDGAVVASLDVVSDVSEVLALEVEVAWYDEAGRLLGATRHVVPPETAERHHGPTGVTDLPIRVPSPGGVVATIQVPVLVNE